MAEWIRVRDKLPENNVGVLISDGNTVTAAECCLYDGRFWWNGHGFGGYEWDFYFEDESITHWMPLPEAPKGVS